MKAKLSDSDKKAGSLLQGHGDGHVRWSIPATFVRLVESPFRQIDSDLIGRDAARVPTARLATFASFVVRW